jgi:hypothetical protein
MQQAAILKIEEGEEIVLMHTSVLVPEHGFFKLLAKKRKDGKIEWAHFVQRAGQLKENVYRGEVEDEKQLQKVLEIMNRNLTRIFGPLAEMKAGNPEFSAGFGKMGMASD